MGTEITIDKNSKLENMRTEIKELLAGHIGELRRESAEELMNGSLLKAKNNISNLEEIEKEAKNLNYAFEKILLLFENGGKTSSAGRNSDEKKEENNGENLIPILKSLIFLGGSASVDSIVEYLVNEEQNYSSADDCKEIISKEQKKMQKNKFIEISADSGFWEILPKGIDYLSEAG